MGFIRRDHDLGSNRTPLPATDKPDPPEPKQPKLSPKRKAAIERAIAEGRAQSVAHALFKARGGVLTLPD